MGIASPSTLVWLDFRLSGVAFTKRLEAPNGEFIGDGELGLLPTDGTGNGVEPPPLASVLNKVAVVVRPTIGLISCGWRIRRRFFGSFDLEIVETATF